MIRLVKFSVSVYPTSFKININTMFEYFNSLPNSYFTDYIIGNDNSCFANLHRDVYFGEINRTGEIYYSLGRKNRNKAIRRAVAEVFKEIILKKIDAESVNLHLHLYNISKNHFYEIKKELIEKSKSCRENAANQRMINFI
jgi:hypothetical protein